MERIFLLGAGATTAIYEQCPTSMNFLNTLKEKYPSRFERIEKFFGATIDPKNIDIEDMLAIVVKNDSSVKQKGITREIFHAIYDLIGVSTKSVDSQILSCIRGNTIHDATLLTHLLDNTKTDKDAFITLNYDRCLDTEIMLKTGRINYDLSPKHKGTISVTEGTGNTYTLYRLHGALGWEYGDAENSHRINIQVGTNRNFTNRPEKQCLLPPGTKEIPDALEPLWAKAEERLRTAKKLIVIGCSLNPQDKRLIKLIKTFKGEVKIIYKNGQNRNNSYDQIFGINGYKEHVNGFDEESLNFIFS